jgi:peroxiredoxin
MLHRIGKIALIAASSRSSSMPVFAHPARQESAVGTVWRLGELVEFPPLKRIDGSEISWTSYRGKVLIIVFWASWCPFCAQQNPLLDRFYRTHQSRGLAMVGISIDKTAELAQQYIAKHGYRFEVAHAPPTWQAIVRQRKGLPQLFLFDRAGVLRQIELREMLDDDVDALSRYL